MCCELVRIDDAIMVTVSNALHCISETSDESINMKPYL